MTELARIDQESQGEIVLDPIESAKAAGLRYVSDTEPGIRRQRRGDQFLYFDPQGRQISDPNELQRIKSLGIPPAWTDVWICPRANGHLQATGRDAKRRKQYRYHARWREVRDETKYGRVIAFGLALPRIRARVERDLRRPELSRAKVLATVVRLLETTLIRVGNQEYARDNKSYGLTTMRDKHVIVDDRKLTFRFRGKSGKQHKITLNDRRLARIVKRCRDLPGYELFQYVDELGQPQTIDSSDVNDYLREIAGQEFTAKDFRTWAGTVLAAMALQEFEPHTSQTQAKKNIVRAVEHVAERLGNTPSICRKCYVHPAVLDAYLDGSLLDTLEQRAAEELREAEEELGPEEARVLRFLRQRLAQAGVERAV
jgi:DNA topoisomerase-1